MILLCTHSPATLVLIFSSHDCEAYLTQAIEAGVTAGRLSKEEIPQRFIEAIRGVVQGERLSTGEQLDRTAT
ncbi:MAG: hypothetical protein RBT75_15830 [Anaerolineae bacterium]|jgi:DNA-binding NarL/FixJ family response regulator|nr:hypothetical protein [Anaerolineae bacterium]